MFVHSELFSFSVIEIWEWIMGGQLHVENDYLALAVFSAN